MYFVFVTVLIYTTNVSKPTNLVLWQVFCSYVARWWVQFHLHVTFDWERWRSTCFKPAFGI